MAPTLYDEKLEPGDLIEISRGAYHHWAVYVGDGFIVHLAPPSEVPGAGANRLMSVVADKAVVSKDELWSVVGDSEWKINNSLDKEYEPRRPDDIVREACAMVGHVLPYCVFSQNCEHVANELRYGKAESRQVHKAGQAVLLAGAATAMLLGVAYLFSGSKKENKNNQ
uniref:LRAT domain-containing protein n=1 Tax=Gasterosteus aculeatus aculeatus TaxID=481459 RepID=A0AAQ4PFK1_GASAC|nr:phospholipase A and acyltransferase 3-like [Gasterosteus aculeatus aculeatus]